MKIIQIAGTSGSGKSTTVRRVLAQATEQVPEFEEGRARPISYRIALPGVTSPLFLLGHYEAPTGGCDTIHDVAKICRLVEEKSRVGHVLFEGLFAMNHTRGPLLARALGVENFVLVRLNTPLEICFNRIDQRRAAEGKGPLESRKNTEGNNVRAGNYAAKMSFIGVRVHRVTSNEAPELILGLLREAK